MDFQEIAMDLKKDIITSVGSMFEEQFEKFEGINKKFEGIGRRFDRVDKEIKELAGDLAIVDEKVNWQAREITKIKKDVEETKKDVKSLLGLKAVVKNHEKRIIHLENNL